MAATAHDTYDSADRTPPFAREIRELVRYRDLVRQLVSRNIKVRYKRSVLGVAWSVLSPLLTMVVLSLVFSTLFQPVAPRYPIFLLPGLLLWGFFSQSTSVMAAEAVGGADFCKRIYVPNMAFGVATTLTGLTHLALALVALAPVMVVFGARAGTPLLALPLITACAALFTLGVGLIVSAAARRFADVLDLYQVLLTAWMYFTPVIYPSDIVPPAYRWLFNLNPMTWMVDAFRAPIYRDAWPPAFSLAVCLAFGVGTFAAGLWSFTRESQGSIAHG